MSLVASRARCLGALLLLLLAIPVGQSADVDVLLDEAASQGIEAQTLSSATWVLLADGELDVSATLLVVVSPPVPFAAKEAAALADFVSRGGHLLVADNFGHAGSLTVAMGLGFERVRLVQGSADVEVMLHGQRYDLRLPAPTALRVDGEVQVLATSHASSFLDRDGDGLIGVADPPGPFPLVARRDVGAGSIIAVADPSIFAALPDNRDNNAFVATLIEDALPRGGLVLIDVSREARHPFIAGMAHLASAATADAWRPGMLVAASITLGGLFIAKAAQTWGPHRFRPDRFLPRRGPALDDEARSGATWSARGIAALAACPVLAAAALAFGSREAAYAAAFLGIGLAYAASRPKPSLTVERTLSTDLLPERGDLAVELQLRNRSGTWREIDVLDALPESFEVEGACGAVTCLRPGQTMVLAYKAQPALRGPYSVGPLRLRTQDPLGLRSEIHELPPAKNVRVLPRREDVRQVPFRTRIPTITLGPHMVNRAGEGSEFHALRPYQTGDSIRIVNWKASARSQGLVVNQRVHESMARLLVFLDARAISAAGPASKAPIAAGCRAVLSVAAGAMRIRDRVRIVVYGDGVEELPTMPASRQIHALTEFLAALPARGTTGFARAVEHVRPSLKPGTPVMLASGLEDDPTVLDGMRVLAAQGLLPFVVAAPVGVEPVDGEGTPEPDGPAILARRKQTAQSLQALGIPVFESVDGVPLDYVFRMGGGR